MTAHVSPVVAAALSDRAGDVVDADDEAQVRRAHNGNVPLSEVASMSDRALLARRSIACVGAEFTLTREIRRRFLAKIDGKP